MWQKARIIHHRFEKAIIGRDIWVRAGKPIFGIGTDYYTGETRSSSGYEIPIISPSFGRSVMGKDDLELLPEFTEDVPFISWEEFLTGDPSQV